MTGHDHAGHDHAGHAHENHVHDHAGHDHAGHHHPAPPAGFDRAFAWGAGINAAFVAAEVAAGLLANSVALLADAAHNLGDVLGLLLAWGAATLARRRPTATRTYGLGRTTILAALINGAVLMLGTGALLVEAMQRLLLPGGGPLVGWRVVAVTAGMGILVNGGTALLFMRGGRAGGDLNVRGAFLHMASDALVSLGVVAAAVLIAATGWQWVDPVVSLGIAVLILGMSWGLLRDSANLAMDRVPPGIDPVAVRAWLSAQPGVTDVHDLHIWPLSTTESALTAHLVRPHPGPDDDMLVRTCAGLRERFGIGHATLQVEQGDPAFPCALASDSVV